MFSSNKGRFFMLVLVIVALGAAFSLGSAQSGPDAVEQKVTINAASFHPDNEITEYQNNGWRLYARTFSSFFAGIQIPGTKQVTRFRIYVSDETNSDDLCATLYKGQPATGNSKIMGYVCTSGNEDGVRVFETTNINNEIVSPSDSVYISFFVGVGVGQDLSFHGARVFYERLP